MSLTTEERLAQQREEFTREAIDTIAKPAVAETVTSTVVPPIETLTGQVNELKTLVENLPTKYVTQDDMQSFVDKISDMIDSKFETFQAKLRKEQEERLVIERETTNKQLAGYVTSEDYGQLRGISRDTVAQLAELKGAHHERLSAMEAGLSELRQSQRTTTASVEAIQRDANSIKESVALMQRTYTEEIERDRKRQEEIDREFRMLKESNDKNIRDIREAQTDILRQDQDINDQRVRIIEFLTPLNLLVNGDKSKNIKGLNDRVTFIEDAIKAALWFVNTPAGRRVTGAAVAALVSTNLISILASLTN